MGQMMLCREIVVLGSTVGRGQWMTGIRDAGKQVLTQFTGNNTMGPSPIGKLVALYVCLGCECERDVTEWGVEI